MNRIQKFIFPLLGLLTLLVLAACNTIGTSSKKLDYNPVLCRFYLETPNGDPNAAEPLPLSGLRVATGTDPVLMETDIGAVNIGKTGDALYLVFHLRSDAARALYQITTQNIGRRLVLRINGDAVGVLKVTGPIGNGSIAMYVELADSGLAELVKNINKTCESIDKELKKG